MNDHGYHWTPCRGSGGGGLGLGLLIALVIVAACARTAERAAAELVQVVAITVAGLLVVGAVTGVVIWRVRRSRAAAVRAARPVVLTAVAEPARLEVRQAPAAIEAPRAGVSAHPHVVTSRAARPRCAHRGDRRS